MKRYMCLTMALCMLLTLHTTYASALPKEVEAIQNEALEGKYHFEYVGDQQMSAQLKAKLVEEDHIILNDDPTGSLTIAIKDADTGEAIKDAHLYLAFMTKRATVDQSGNSVQTANPYLLFDLGKSGTDGTFVFKDTYYYNTDVIEPGTKPFATHLQVHLAYVIDEDPLVTLDMNTLPNWYHQDEASFNAFMDALGGTTVPFSKLKTELKAATKDTYNDRLREFFNYDFARYDDSVLVKVGNAMEFSALSPDQQKSLSIGDLKQYIKDQRQLFIDYVAKRHYNDFAGFEPDFVMQFEPPYEYVETYKDGTSATKEEKARLGLSIFDQATGGTGYAINYSFMSYRAFVFAEGYVSGKSNGTAIRQDFVDLDAKSTVYLSRSAAPVVAMNQYNTVFGTLKDPQGQPVIGAKIKIVNADKSATSNAKGEFSFVSLKDEQFVLQITSAENGQALEGYAVFKNKAYSLSSIPILLTGQEQVFHVDLVTGPIPKGPLPGADGGLGSGLGQLPWTLILGGFIGVLALLVVVLLVLLFKKKKKNNR